MRLPITASVICCIFAVAPLNAQLLVEDSFDYANTKQLTKKANAGTGWQGAWQSIGKGKVELTEGLKLGSLKVKGKGVRVLEKDRREHLLARKIGPKVPDGTTLWVSFLFRADAEGHDQAVHEVRISNHANDFYNSGPNDDPTSLEVDESNNWYRRLRTHATEYGGEPLDPAVDIHDDRRTDADSELEVGVTYLIVGRYTNLSARGSVVQGTVWAISDESFVKIAKGGFTTKELDKHATAKATEAENYNAKVAAGDFVQLVGFRNIAQVPVKNADESEKTKTVVNEAGEKTEEVVTEPVPVGVFDEVRIGYGNSPTEAGIIPVVDAGTTKSSK